MPRVKRGVTAKKKHKRILEQAKGYFGRKSKIFRAANEQVLHSMAYSYRDRKVRKREFRRLWITRISAAAKINGTSYNKLISGLKMANVDINRKMLSDLAITDPDGFTKLVEIAKEQTEAKTAV